MVEKLEGLAKIVKWNSFEELQRGTHLKIYAVQGGRNVSDFGYFKRFDKEKDTVIIAKDKEELCSLPDVGIHIKKDDYINHDLFIKGKPVILKKSNPPQKGPGIINVTPRPIIKYKPLPDKPDYKKSYGKNAEGETVCYEIGGTCEIYKPCEDCRECENKKY